MALNYVTFINNNTPGLTSQQKTKFLDDFCARHGYLAESGLTKTQFANQKIEDFIVGDVNAYRREEAQKVVSIETLVFS